MLEIDKYLERLIPAIHAKYTYVFQIVENGSDVVQVRLEFDHHLIEDELKNLKSTILQQAQEQIDNMDAIEQAYKPFPKEV